MKRTLVGALVVSGMALLLPAGARAQENPVAAEAPAPVPYTPAPVISTAQPEGAPTHQPSVISGSVNGGFGIPYGGIGGQVTLGFDYLAVSAGAGTVFYGSGWSVGARVYLADTSHKFRPHLTAVYGTTAAYQITVIGGTDLQGTMKGFGFYAGLDHDVGDPGAFFMTYGVGVITHEDFPQEVKNLVSSDKLDAGTPVKIMVGVGYRFGGQ